MNKIVDNWKQVLKTYSFLFHTAAVLVTLIDIVLPYMTLIQPIMTTTTYGCVMFGLNVCGGVGRFIKQQGVTTDVRVDNQ